MPLERTAQTYSPGNPIPYVFEREVISPTDQRPYKIRVDFLTHQLDSRPGQHRHLPVQDDLLTKEAISRIRAAFATRETNGPAWVSTFLQPDSQAEKDQIITDAFMTVHELDALLF